MNRHEEREKFVFVLYQHLLLNEDIEDAYLNNFEDYSDDFLNNLKKDISINENIYIDNISKYLKSWSFNRLNFVDQAILLCAASEISLKLADKAVIIDEAVRLSKTYSDEDAYKYINGVLDNL